MMETLTFLLSGTMIAATPFLIAAFGGLINEKAGVLNLSIEGMMAFGAAVAFISVSLGAHYTFGLGLAGLAGALLAFVFGLVAIVLMGNQVAVGLAVGILGLGLSGLIGQDFEATTVPTVQSWPVPYLSEIPILGPGLFDHTPLVYLAPLLAVATWYTLRNTRIGLALRAAGENPHAAHAVGVRVLALRMAATLYGGFMAGLAGGFISVVSATLWAEGMIAGRGWIVVALLVFATWRVGRILLGAYLFGAATLSGLLVQTFGLSVPSQLLTSFPYIVTIVAIAIFSMDGRQMVINAPASLGQTYHQSK